MAYSRRCSTCATNWPYMSAFTVCPLCDTDTWFQSDTKLDDMLTKQEADQLVATHEAEIRAREEHEVKMDRAFDAWFLRENGIAPWGEPARHGQTMAPLSEFLPL